MTVSVSEVDTSTDCTPTETPIAAAAPTKVDLCETASDLYTIPSTAHVTYHLNSANGTVVYAGNYSTNGASSITIVAVADQGYVLTTPYSWTLEYTNNASCAEIVTPAEVTFYDICGTANDTYTIPESEGVNYYVNDSNTPAPAGTYPATGTVSVYAQPQEGYAFGKAVTEWSHTFTNEACPITVVPTTPTHVDICGTANDTYTIPESEGVVYYVNDNEESTPAGTYPATGDVTITAHATKGYEFGDHSYSWTFSFTNTSCTVTPCRIMNPLLTVTKASEFADYQDTRSSGLYGFTNDGLKIWTTDNTSQAKVAWYHLNNYPLTDIGTPSMNYTMDTSAGLQQIAPGLQIVVDFNGDGSAMGTLVGESVYGNDWWLTNGSNASVKANAPHTGGGNGSNWFGTLNEWLTNFPNAKVTAVGFSLGSGVYAGGTLKSITFGCQQWNFTAPENPGKGGETPTPTPTPAVELPHTGPQSSINYLLLGVITAVTIYGAIYFAQPKKLYE